MNPYALRRRNLNSAFTRKGRFFREIVKKHGVDRVRSRTIRTNAGRFSCLKRAVLATAAATLRRDAALTTNRRSICVSGRKPRCRQPCHRRILRQIGRECLARGRGGTGRRTRFRFWHRKMWGFKSLRPHHRPRGRVDPTRRRRHPVVRLDLDPFIRSRRPSAFGCRASPSPSSPSSRAPLVRDLRPAIARRARPARSATTLRSDR